MNDPREEREGERDAWDEILERDRLNEGCVLLCYADALRRLGLIDPREQKLGRGAFGHAYRLGPKDAPTGVVKITRDVFDAVASMSIMGKHFTHLPRTKGVWALAETFYQDWSGWYAIEREYLHPVSAADHALLEVLFQIYDNDRITDLRIPKRHNRAMRDKWRVYARELLGQDGAPGVAHLPRAMELLAEIGEGVQELASVGIDWSDMSPENIMRTNDGTLKIADVGFCELRFDVDNVIVPEMTASAVHLPRLAGK